MGHGELRVDGWGHNKLGSGCRVSPTQRERERGGSGEGAGRNDRPGACVRWGRSDTRNCGCSIEGGCVHVCESERSGPRQVQQGTVSDASVPDRMSGR